MIKNTATDPIFLTEHRRRLQNSFSVAGPSSLPASPRAVRLLQSPSPLHQNCCSWLNIQIFSCPQRKGTRNLARANTTKWRGTVCNKFICPANLNWMSVINLFNCRPCTSEAIQAFVLCTINSSRASNVCVWNLCCKPCQFVKITKSER